MLKGPTMKIVYRVAFFVLLPATILSVGCDCECEDDATIHPADANLCRLDHGENTAAWCREALGGVCIDQYCVNCDNCQEITSDAGPANAAAEALLVCAP